MTSAGTGHRRAGPGSAEYRALRRLTAAYAGELVVGYDVAQALTGWPMTAMLWA